MIDKKLTRLFNPAAIAIIGASEEKDSVGLALMNNLKSSKIKIYPINLKHEKILGIKAYKNITDVKQKIDLAIVAVPAVVVPAVMEQCGQAGVGGVIIISSGFEEAGAVGEERSAAVLATAKKYGMRVLGPNCLGFNYPPKKLNASFADGDIGSGNIAFISQSGALCSAVLDWAKKNRVGFSYFISIGSGLDVSFYDLIEYCSADKNTKAILIYMESLKSAKEFIAAASKISSKKPIFILKSGRTNAGAKAAKSHTGALAGDNDVYNAAFDKAGIVRLDDSLEFFQTAKILNGKNWPMGKRLTIITNAGGPGVLAADEAAEKNVKLEKLSSASIKALKEFLPANASFANPIDILGDADAGRYEKAIKICLEDKNTDAVLAILTPQTMTEPTAVARDIVKLYKNSKKPLFACWMGGPAVAEAGEIFDEAGIAVYRSPEEAINVFGKIILWHDKKEFAHLSNLPTSHGPEIGRNKNKKLLAKIQKENRKIFTEEEAKEFLANYGVPMIKSRTAKNSAEAVNAAKKIGFPVVMKILSPDIIHKIDVGGVILDIKSEKEAKAAYQQIVSNVKKNSPQAKIEGVFIEEMAKKKYEVLIGAKRDNVFGAILLFGQGGTAAEVERDTKVVLPPLNEKLALKIISQTKISRLLEGYRGARPADLKAISKVMILVSQLAADFPEIKELDINPLVADETGEAALDVKIILE